MKDLVIAEVEALCDEGGVEYEHLSEQELSDFIKIAEARIANRQMRDL